MIPIRFSNFFNFFWFFRLSNVSPARNPKWDGAALIYCVGREKLIKVGDLGRHQTFINVMWPSLRLLFARAPIHINLSQKKTATTTTIKVETASGRGRNLIIVPSRRPVSSSRLIVPSHRPVSSSRPVRLTVGWFWRQNGGLNDRNRRYYSRNDREIRHFGLENWHCCFLLLLVLLLLFLLLLLLLLLS